MKKILFIIFPLLSACVSDPPMRSQPPKRGVEPVLVLDRNHKTVLSYTNSYALIIGQQNYFNGWSSLDTVHGEVSLVETVLKDQGFIVEKHLDLDSTQLEATFSQFIKKYGFEPNNRLLFFFSGHGHSRFKGKKGYIVPIDAPHPSKAGFVQKALSMNKIRALATEIEAKHALFLFDSCFSGTLFKDKALSEEPAYITDAIAHQTRQFITAGRAKEKVPAKSVFTPAFVNALRFKRGDLNKDGYVTGLELGLHLATVVPKHSPRQHPQHGKIEGYDFAYGDFVFVLDKTKRIPPPPPVVPTQIVVPDMTQESAEIKRLKWEIAQAKQESADLREQRDKDIALKKQVEENKRKQAERGYHYTDNGNGTVTDNRSGLIWMKNANCFGSQNWHFTMQSAANLSSGDCGLRDGSRRGDWRLPTEDEWRAMLGKKYNKSLLFAAFSRVASWYWSSTYISRMPNPNAWLVDLNGGSVFKDSINSSHYAWPVRAGQ